MTTGTISGCDYLNAQKLHRADAVLWYYRGAGIAVALGIALYFFSDPNLAFIVAGGGVGAANCDFIMSKTYLPWKARRVHRQQKDLAFPFTYTWDSEFLEAQGISGYSKREWVTYTKCKEDEKLFLLYHSDNLFEMIPKSWCRDETQLAGFRRLANRVGKT